MPSFFITSLLSPALVLISTFVQVQMGAIITAEQGDCLLIMGSKVLRSGQPDLMMRERVSKALEVYNEDYEVVIVTGGTIDPDTPPESTVLRRLLAEGGVASEKIEEESESTSTYENLINSRPLIQENGCERVDILSHDFHLPRIAMTASRLDIPLHRLIGATAEGRSMSRLHKREYAAFLIYWLGWDWVFQQ